MEDNTQREQELPTLGVRLDNPTHFYTFKQIAPESREEEKFLQYSWTRNDIGQAS
jgi:hypothetical protein